MKKQKFESRTALRLPSGERKRLDKLVESGEFRNISQILRTALKEFLSTYDNGGKDYAAE